MMNKEMTNEQMTNEEMTNEEMTYLLIGLLTNGLNAAFPSMYLGTNKPLFVNK